MPSDGRSAAPLPHDPARRRFAESSRAQTLVDASGRLVDVNAAFCRLVGHPRTALLGRHASTLSHPDDPGEADAALAAVLTGEREAVQVERLIAHAEGRPVPALLDVVAERDEHGQCRGASSVVFDLTGLREVERRAEHQHQVFDALSRRATDLALVVDTEARLMFISPASRHVLGHDPQENRLRCSWEFVHPGDLETAQAAFARVVHDGASATFDLRVRDAQGDWRWMEATVTNLLDTPVAGLVANLHDVTARKEVEQALHRSEARYRAIADAAEEGIWAVDPEGATLYANARMASLLGRDLRQLYTEPWQHFAGEQTTQEVVDRLPRGTTHGIQRYEVGYPHPDGRERRLWIAASPLVDGAGEQLGSLAMVSDVTEVRRTEAELRRAVLHDGLTGLPNRALLHDRLEHALERETSGTAVVVLDLDHFKHVNDARGHEVGDQLVLAVADRLRSAVRPTDTLARVGGDEFVVVCEDVDEAEAHAVAQELLAGLTGPVELAGGPVHVRASAGVAVSPPGSAGDLLRFADAALHAAKASGRGRVRLFHRPLAEEAERRDALGADLRVALDSGALTLHHQPVVDLRTGAVAGTEALARWRSPVHGQVPPDVFVAVAEETGLALALDSWAAGQALLDACALRAAGAVAPGTYVAVNLSARSLDEPLLEQVLVQACSTTGLPPDHVVLEVTESAMMEDVESAAVLLRRLRERGFRVAVDDFGTGYSSLAYVRTLPLTTIKIDRSFIAGIDHDADALAVVASIVDLSRAVGVTTVAEGVETEQQAALLRRLGCTHAQGWLWSPAVPVADAVAAAWSAGFTLPPPGRPRSPRRGAAVAGAEHGLDRLLALHRSGASLSTVAAALNREGFRTPAGLRWKHTSVANAIADAAYPGLGEEPA